MDLNAFGHAVQSSSFGVWAGGEAYPFANLVHILGLIMLVGGIGILDLRLAGLFRRLPAAPLASALTPIALAGLLLMIPSGVTMFAADASALIHSTTFRTKLLLIALALANAAAFRFLWHARIEQWDADPPAWGRLMAAASLLLWLSVASLGRWIAYS
ncbi:MAG TPA: DUF6644 family protein [Sphingomicrobium sp.]